jgi:hypothetical protein
LGTYRKEQGRKESKERGSDRKGGGNAKREGDRRWKDRERETERGREKAKAKAKAPERDVEMEREKVAEKEDKEE